MSKWNYRDFHDCLLFYALFFLCVFGFWCLSFRSKLSKNPLQDELQMLSRLVVLCVDFVSFRAWLLTPPQDSVLCSIYSPVISALPAVMSVIPAIWQCHRGKRWGVWICRMKALVTSVILVFEDQNASWDRWFLLLRNWGHKQAWN